MPVTDIVTSDVLGSWLEDYTDFTARLPASDPSAVAQLRHHAIGTFSGIGFPSKDIEEWRFTDVTPITEMSFRRATREESELSPVDVVPYSYVECGELVFVNGRYAPTFSSICELPEEAVMGNLADALTSHPEKVQAHLGRYVDYETDAFAALNTAYVRDGAFIYIPRGEIIRDPLHILYLSTNADAPTVSYPRLLVIAEEGSEVVLVESYAGTSGGTYLSAPVTEIIAGEGARVEHYRIQHESEEAWHISSSQVYCSAGSEVTSQSMSFGGAFVRNSVGAVLHGEGAQAKLNGLYLINGTQFVDNHLDVDHARSGCTSYQLYKGILEDEARAVFAGRIHVRPGAQQTDAEQENRNLILSPQATALSMPQLEIFADDVKCTHGSTVGELDEDALFYLRSRGIGAEEAMSMLIYAFASEYIDHVTFRPVRKTLERFIVNRLPHGEIVRQGVS